MSTASEHAIDIEGVSPYFAEAQYARFATDPASVDQSWRSYFERMEGAVAETNGNGGGNGSTNRIGPSWARTDWPPLPDDDLTGGLVPGMSAPEAKSDPGKAAPGKVTTDEMRASTLDSIRALMMIRSYRVRGHLICNLDPLGLEARPPHPELEPATYGFGEDDLDRPIFIDHVLGLETATIREILEIVRRTYCSTVGVEFMHINDPDEKSWIQQRIEGRNKEIQFTREGKLAILEKLLEAEQFEIFLGRKYTGTKRFGLDGGEAAIPALEAVIKTGGQLGIKEIVVGMPHRGRLNVLANVFKKPYRAIFHEFHGGSAKPDDVEGSGDVKYHLGTSADRDFDGNIVHMSLTANPSHLEAVDPVVLGKVRAKQTLRVDHTHNEVLSLLMHGDAAFSGQGLVAECFMLSGLPGYSTGGTIHFIVNNQIGFTTAPSFSRSSPYPSNMAKMVQAPIFHVNGDDPEAVVYVTKVATEFRQRFKRDVVIDMFCYRRFGHNESDEPSFTQPLMYANIKNHPHTGKIYGQRLIGEGLITEADLKAIEDKHRKSLDVDFAAAEGYEPDKADWFEGRWADLSVASGGARRAKTGVPEEELIEIGRTLTTVPENLHVHRTLSRVLEAKAKMFETGQGFDWATAEALSFGSMLLEDIPIRLSGQDSARGTFSHRHSRWIDQRTEARYTPLDTLSESATFEVHDSPLSEAGVLGFEYGFSLAEPKALVIWEAQFGDFANGAQMIIDQFISSGEAKWLRMSGLVMLLPHGYEGQGPEHSSARPERYLQMCAEDNMQIANCSTPAQHYHILRRQMLRSFRKPLIIFSPKSLLRHKRAVSSLSDMAAGSQFHRLLWDDAQSSPGSAPNSKTKLKPDAKIKRLILCTGKVYYDLLEEREARNQDDTYILRVEQLYPFPKQPLVEEISRFANLERVVWCQEEPKNMGAWRFIEWRIQGVMKIVGCKPKRPFYAGRLSSAATATGLASVHAKQQAELVDQALTI